MNGARILSGAAVRLALLFFSAAVPMLLWAPSLHAEMRLDQLWVITSSGMEKQIDVEIAETPQEKSLGLMFRTELPDGRGMLFPYGAPQDVTMWMRNTYIPLDMVFIRGDGVVYRIERRTEPMSERIISSQGPVTAVLEIAGGAADRMGLKPGDRVRHPLFKSGAP